MPVYISQLTSQQITESQERKQSAQVFLTKQLTAVVESLKFLSLQISAYCKVKYFQTERCQTFIFLHCQLESHKNPVATPGIPFQSFQGERQNICIKEMSRAWEYSRLIGKKELILRALVMVLSMPPLTTQSKNTEGSCIFQ